MDGHVTQRWSCDCLPLFCTQPSFTTFWSLMVVPSPARRLSHFSQCGGAGGGGGASGSPPGEWERARFRGRPDRKLQSLSFFLLLSLSVASPLSPSLARPLVLRPLSLSLSCISSLALESLFHSCAVSVFFFSVWPTVSLEGSRGTEERSETHTHTGQTCTYCSEPHYISCLLTFYFPTASHHVLLLHTLTCLPDHQDLWFFQDQFPITSLPKCTRTLHRKHGDPAE